MRLLVVEDDERVARHLIRGLQESGHVVDLATEGETALAMAMEGLYDAAIVDRRLPLLDGMELVKALRQGACTTPVLMLSAVAGPADRAAGLRAGCDDYLGKPYAFAEVLARLEALVRRGDHSRHAAILEIADLRFDPASRRATRNGKSIVLQHKESLLLEHLMRHVGQVVTRSMLLEAAWGYDFDPEDAIIDRHVHRLRQKIDQGHTHPLIHTIHGAGYRMASEAGT